MPDTFDVAKLRAALCLLQKGVYVNACHLRTLDLVHQQAGVLALVQDLHQQVQVLEELIPFLDEESPGPAGPKVDPPTRPGDPVRWPAPRR
ncbi:MAG: hypothetical protein AAGI71_08475 [Bacteroidota bacterium]